MAGWSAGIAAGGRKLASAVGLACVLSLTAAAGVVFTPMAAEAQRDRDRDRDRDEEAEASNRVFSPEVGEMVQEALASQETEDYAGGIAILERALSRRRISEYEKGVVLQIRASFEFQLGQPRKAIATYDQALREGEFTTKERLDIRFNIGQLYLVEGDYQQFVTRIEAWITDGGQANDKVHLNLVGAYAELSQFRNALRHARLAYQKATPRERKHYDALNFLYSELNMPRERLNLIREMVGVFPTDKGLWLTLAALYAQAGDTDQAFEINKVMYLNGMLEDEGEIMRIVDYFSYYDAPYRGARILEREMNRGRITRSQENYEKLARFYRQAREFGRAVAPLTEAANRSGDGELFKQLGEAFYARGELEDAEGALRQALDRGGLNRTGDAWSLLAATLYEQDARLGRYEAREAAVEAYNQALDYDHSRRAAEGWISFIEKEVETFRARESFAAQVRRDEIRVVCERYARDVITAGGGFDDVDVGASDLPPVPRAFADDPRFDGVDCFALAENPTQYFARLEAERAEAEADTAGADEADEADDAPAAGGGDGVQEG